MKMMLRVAGAGTTATTKTEPMTEPTGAETWRIRLEDSTDEIILS